MPGSKLNFSAPAFVPGKAYEVSASKPAIDTDNVRDDLPTKVTVAPATPAGNLAPLSSTATPLITAPAPELPVNTHAAAIKPAGSAAVRTGPDATTAPAHAAGTLTAAVPIPRPARTGHANDYTLRPSYAGSGAPPTPATVAAPARLSHPGAIARGPNANNMARPSSTGGVHARFNNTWRRAPGEEGPQKAEQGQQYARDLKQKEEEIEVMRAKVAAAEKACEQDLEQRALEKEARIKAQVKAREARLMRATMAAKSRASEPTSEPISEMASPRVLSSTGGWGSAGGSSSGSELWSEAGAPASDVSSHLDRTESSHSAGDGSSLPADADLINAQSVAAVTDQGASNIKQSLGLGAAVGGLLQGVRHRVLNTAQGAARGVVAGMVGVSPAVRELVIRSLWASVWAGK